MGVIQINQLVDRERELTILENEITRDAVDISRAETVTTIAHIDTVFRVATRERVVSHVKPEMRYMHIACAVHFQSRAAYEQTWSGRELPENRHIPRPRRGAGLNGQPHAFDHVARNADVDFLRRR